MPIRILLADDHLVFLLGIRSLLQSEPNTEVVGEVSTGEQAVELFRQFRPGVLLLDLRMPQGGGIEVVRQITAFAPDAGILILTSYEVEEEIFQVLQAGARGYALKDIDRVQLMEAIPARELRKSLDCAHCGKPNHRTGLASAINGPRDRCAATRGQGTYEQRNRSRSRGR